MEKMRKIILTFCAIISVFIMISPVNTIGVTQQQKTNFVNEDDKNKTIHVDPDIYLSKEKHLKILKLSIIFTKNKETKEIIQEIINCLNNPEKGYVNSRDIQNIAEEKTTSDLEIYGLCNVESQGVGKIIPKKWSMILSVVLGLGLIPIPFFAYWQGGILSQTKVSKIYTEKTFSGKHTGFAIGFFDIDTYQNEKIYKMGGEAFLIFIQK